MSEEPDDIMDIHAADIEAFRQAERERRSHGGVVIVAHEVMPGILTHGLHLPAGFIVEGIGFAAERWGWYIYLSHPDLPVAAEGTAFPQLAVLTHTEWHEPTLSYRVSFVEITSEVGAWSSRTVIDGEQP